MSQTRPFTCFLTGETSLLIRCASHLLTQGHNVAGIFSPDVDVNEWAGQQDMTCFTNQQDWLAALQTQDFDYLFSIVNSWIIPPEVLNLPRKGAINFHDSPLPRYAGVNSTTHAIRNDEKQHGISWHQIDEGIDTGDILKQVPVDIAPDDTALSLNLKCYEAAYSAFTELVTALAEDRAEAVKQDLSQRSYYGLWSRPEAACALDWTQPAEQLDALVRALDMGGYRNGVGLPKCVLGDQVLIPAKTKVLENPSNQSPGTLVALEQEAIHVATASKDLAIRQLSSLTGEILPAADWARRCGLQSGHKLDFPDAQQRQKLSELDERYCRYEPYWTRQLATLTPLNLPRDSSTEQTDDYIRITYSAECDADLLSFCFALLLARLSQQNNFTLAFNHPTVAREIAGCEAYFARQVPLNVQIDPAQTCTQARQSWRLDEISAKGTFLYDLLLREPKLRGMSFPADLPAISLIEADATEGHTDALLIETGGTVCHWPAAWQHLADYFAQLVNAILQAPDTPLYQLPLLDQESIEQLQAWNSETLAYPQNENVLDWFAAQVTKTPDAVALVFADEQLSYREVNARSNQLAHYLLSRDSAPLDSPLAICLERSPQLLISVLAVLKTGAAYVPIDPAYPAERIAYMLQDTAAPILLTQSGLNLPLAQLQHDRTVLCLDELNLADQPDNNPALAIKGEDLAYVIYTSGSTGTPKGVMVEHHALALHIQAILQHYQPQPGDTVLQFASLSFDISLEQMLTAWLSGARLLLVNSNLIPPADLLALLQQQAVTVADLPPAYWREMLNIKAIEEALSALRCLILGGEAVASDLAIQTRERFPKLEVFNAYGPTEAAITPTVYHLPETLADDLPYVSIGRARANSRVYILDANNQPLPPGIQGELCIAGGLARGYLNAPELTAEKFIEVELFAHRERIYKTGDLARWLPDGNLDFVGRIDHQIKLRGYRIDLGEIEAALNQHPGVKEAVAVVYEQANNKRLIAYLTTTAKPADTLTAALKETLSASLPNYMVPSHFVVLDSFPVTQNGKIDRKALAAREPAGLGSEYVAPQSAMEKQLAGLWEQALDVERVGLDDSFFDLGGNSLIGLRLVSEIQSAFQTNFGIHDLFDIFTIRAIAAHISTAGAETQKEAISPQPRDGSLLPVVLEAESLVKLFSAIGQDDQLFWQPFRLQGDLNIVALQQAFDAMLQRHEPLRTSLVVEEDAVWQRIEPFQSLPIKQIDLSELNEAQQQEKIIEIFSEARFKPLPEGYMIDTLLLKLGAETYIFAYCVHYFSFDDQAITLFNQQLSACYEAFVNNSTPALPALTVQYADYAAWIKRQFDTHADEPVRGEAELAQFKGPQTLCDFEPDPEAMLPVMKKLSFDRQTAQSFALLNAIPQTTELMIATLLLHALLHRLSGQDKIMTMADFNYRTRKELEGIMGHYAMAAYICTDFSGDPSFSQIIERGRRSMSDFYHNIANLKYCKKVLDDLIFFPDNTAFSDVCCLAVTPPSFFEPVLPLSGLESRYEEFFPYTFYVHFYMHLSYDRQQGRLFGSLNYDNARFKPETPHRMICQLRNLLNGVAANPDTPISQIALSLPEDTCYAAHDLSTEHGRWEF